MNESLGVGVVGAGAIGIRGALTHLSVPDVRATLRLAAICDPVPGRAEAAARKFGVPAWYLSYEELLADPNVDLVTLCSPIGLHYGQGLQAIAAGKHIHFNKTMTITSAEADELIAAAAEKGLRMVASPGMMTFPHNQRARRLVLKGALGRLAWAISGTAGVGDYHMNEEFRTGQDILTDVNPAWYFKRPGGGPQYDVTVYCLHILTGILGPARRVSAFSGRIIPERSYHGEAIRCEMDDNTHLLLDFGEALFGFVYASVKGHLTEGFNPNIYGTLGAITGTKFAGAQTLDLKLPADFQPHVTPEHAALPESHVFEDLMQLGDWVKDGRASIATPEHARHVIEIIEAGYRAAESGATQDLRTTFEPLQLEMIDPV
jgi:predicted dehydrogenase